MPSISTSKINSYISALQSSIDTKNEEVEFFREQIITEDNNKRPIDELIKAVDEDIFNRLEEVNDKLKEVQKAYQARIDGGSRTDLFWRLISSQPPEYSVQSSSRGGSFTVQTSIGKKTYQCTRLNPNGYAGLVGVTTRPSVPNAEGKYPITTPPGGGYIKGQMVSFGGRTIYLDKKEFDDQYPPGSKQRSDYFARYPFGITMKLHPSDEDGTGSPIISTQSSSNTISGFSGGRFGGSLGVSITPGFDEGKEDPDNKSYPPDTKVGFRSDKLHAIKYFDEPRTRDLADTRITSFEGYISVGSSILNVMSGYNSGVLYDVTPGQLVVVGSSSTLKLFPNDYAEIVSIGTGFANLNSSVTLIDATATSVVSASGTIQSINITNPGFGFTGPPTVTISPPIINQATGIASIGAGGKITKLTITNPGFGYTFNPAVSISTSGSTATATAQINSVVGDPNYGSISTISIGNSGFGYLTAPTVTIGPFGRQAVGLASTSTTSGITTVSKIDVVTQGIGYTSNPPPQVIIESPTSGTTAIATALVNSLGILTSISITNPGTGYTFTPIIQISAPTVGQKATATAQINAIVGNPNYGKVTGITITNAGSGYVDIPSVVVSPPGGTITGLATAVVDGVGKVISLSITNPGAGYDLNANPPNIYIEPPTPGIAASAIALVSAGVVTSIVVTNPGVGYSPGSSPSVNIKTVLQDQIKTLTLDVSATTSVGSSDPIDFDVLISASGLSKLVKDLSVPTNLNPYSPQTIGIMNSDQLGIGTFIAYDNSGKSRTTKSWRPELESDEVGTKGTEFYVPAVREPVVGSGLIWYKRGFRYRPMKFDSNQSTVFVSIWMQSSPAPSNITPAKEGDKITVYDGQEDYLLERLPPNQALDDTLNKKINEAKDAIEKLLNSASSINTLITSSNTMRKGRDEMNISIWGKRHLIGQLQSEITELKTQLNYMKDNISNLTS